MTVKHGQWSRISFNHALVLQQTGLLTYYYAALQTLPKSSASRHVPDPQPRRYRETSASSQPRHFLPSNHRTLSSPLVISHRDPPSAPGRTQEDVRPPIPNLEVPHPPPHHPLPRPLHALSAQLPRPRLPQTLVPLVLRALLPQTRIRDPLDALAPRRPPLPNAHPAPLLSAPSAPAALRLLRPPADQLYLRGD